MTEQERPLIIHALPQNSSVSGGIKVHYQLCELERELGYDSFIAFPDDTDVPIWFAHTCKVINYAQAREMFHLTATTQPRPSLVVGWEDPNPVRQFNAAKRVCYIQGECFVNRAEPYLGIGLWYSSRWNENQVLKPGWYVPPFVDDRVFYPPSIAAELTPGPRIRILVQARKGGKTCWSQVQQYLSPIVHNRIEIHLIDDMSEAEFAEQMRLAEIFFAHSTPEGFGLPAMEAMASNTLVVGFTGGGGTDFMDNGGNCYWAPDSNYKAIAQYISKAVMNPEATPPLLARARLTAHDFSRHATKIKLMGVLLQVFKFDVS